MKLSGPKGRLINRLESIKQAILLFVHSKLTINPDHRFAFASLAQVASWHQKEFSNEVGSAIASLRGLVYSHSPQGNADLTQLFRIAAHEAKKSRAQNCLLRVYNFALEPFSIVVIRNGQIFCPFFRPSRFLWIPPTIRCHNQTKRPTRCPITWQSTLDSLITLRGKRRIGKQ
ncbi:hypothetical protein MKX01_031888 [Papaver californicum]|nr:hypothetical protein MKX01_031888 [Papaver californicum]